MWKKKFQEPQGSTTPKGEKEVRGTNNKGKPNPHWKKRRCSLSRQHEVVFDFRARWKRGDSKVTYSGWWGTKHPAALTAVYGLKKKAIQEKEKFGFQPWGASPKMGAGARNSQQGTRQQKPPS